MPNILDHSKNKISLIVQDSYTNSIYDLSHMNESITWTTSRDKAQPGTLTFLVKEGIVDDGVIINPGSHVRFGVNGISYFLGRIQEPSLLNSVQDGVLYSFTANNGLDILAAEESATRTAGQTASEFFDSLMLQQSARIQSVGGLPLRWAVREPSTAHLSEHYYLGEPLYSMLSDCLTDTHIAEPRQYMVRDNAGILEFRELQALKTPYILGDDSYVGSYVYGVNLDNTYNLIKVVRDNAEIGMRDTWHVYDSESVGRHGYKQLVVEADEHMNDGQINEMARLYLTALNRPNRSMRLECLGINGLQAGDGIRVQTARARIDSWHWIEEITHVYTLEAHKMDVMVYV
jgi:hypothetical protein